MYLMWERLEMLNAKIESSPNPIPERVVRELLGQIFEVSLREGYVGGHSEFGAASVRTRRRQGRNILPA